MSNVHGGPLLVAALTGSGAILLAMYFLLPALGLPRLDFTAVTGGWVGATGRHAKVVGAAVFLLGGIAWAFLYAAFWPWHSVWGAIAFGLIPFAISMLSVLPSLNQFRIQVYPVPGFMYLKFGGPNAIVANLVEHLIFGLCLGMFYR
ncbi:MAG TPA: hypothetical protein VNT01_03050 [Symbiobacteriaceae bacterium]|nr:hypothetical protein [Symbiobacteriaceae bacterium]